MSKLVVSSSAIKARIDGGKIVAKHNGPPIKVRLCQSPIKVSLPDENRLSVIRVGVPGPQGPEGPQGPQGERGPKGDPGSGELSVEIETDENLAAGTPVYVKSNGRVARAQANSFPQTRFAGMAKSAVSIGFAANVITAGPLELTAGEWDAVTGQVGGLTVGNVYFLSATTSGQISTIPPSVTGEFSTKVGKALTTTTLDIDPRNPIKL